jgi:hypothetical protein
MLLANVPEPVPSVVLEFAIVGFKDVLQHTPLAETAAPPSEVIFPPLVAVLPVIEDGVVVVTVGTDETSTVVKEISEP